MLRIGQVEATATQDGKYTDGSVAGGIAATRLRAAAFNAMQEELAHIVESAGLTLDINDMTQVLKAIQKLTLSRTNPFADIKSDGAAAISTALTNLGLGDVAKAGVAGGLLASDGYITLPLIIGGVKTNVILQWVTGPTAGAETVNYPNVTFPVTFPNACLFAAPFTVGNNTTSADQIFQAVSWTTSTAKVFPQWFGSGSQGLVHPIILAIGW
ncbi:MULTISPECIES: gp53-like domain-containing protein [Enterobacter cloacae complex]|uniref:gp53-like domain-containing protein n=1 Tax=Enterobacter cloacae complex TaxID=354276 RepID=UPI0021007450|nr:hypothetical protein [Enterobacter cloacae complex sp. ECNIH14]